jgi:NDP-sugar pyrophosphorylase family protein
MSKCNRIGSRCRIHRTAILEGCEIGDDVEIGPYAYLRSTVVGNRVVLREKSAVKMSYLGERAFVMGSDIVNCYIGAETSIFAPMVYNAVFGERGFLSGGSGFADFIVGAASIPAMIDGVQVPSGLPFLASAVGDDCFIGANLVFAPGRTIPDGTRLLDHGLIKSVPARPDGAYVVSGGELVQIPDSFLGRKGA